MHRIFTAEATPALARRLLHLSTTRAMSIPETVKLLSEQDRVDDPSPVLVQYLLDHALRAAVPTTNGAADHVTLDAVFRAIGRAGHDMVTVFSGHLLPWKRVLDRQNIDGKVVSIHDADDYDAYVGRYKGVAIIDTTCSKHVGTVCSLTKQFERVILIYTKQDMPTVPFRPGQAGPHASVRPEWMSIALILNPTLPDHVMAFDDRWLIDRNKLGPIFGVFQADAFSESSPYRR